MGKSSSQPAIVTPQAVAPAAPVRPDFEALARQQAELSKINEIGPNGSVTWNGNTRTTSLSPEQQALYSTRIGQQQAVGGVGSQRINELTSDTDARSRIADALYKQSTKYYDTNFGNQEQALRTQLLNSGLDENSAAYGKAFGEFTQRRDNAYGDAANTASLQAEQQSQSNQTNAVNRLMALLNYSGGVQTPQATASYQNPDLLGAVGAGYSADLNASNLAYDRELNASNANLARQSSRSKGLGSALGGAAGLYFGGGNPLMAGAGAAIGGGLFSSF